MDTEENAQIALKNLIQFGMLPSAVIFERVLKICFRKKIESIIEGDYNQASVYDISLAKLSKLQAENQIEFKMFEMKQKGSLRIKQIEERIKITKQLFDEKIQKLEDECDRKVTEMKLQQETEIDDFEKKWNSPEYMAHFSKPSYNLLQLRFIEKKHAIFKDYQEARKTKMEADKLQSYEECSAHTLMEQSMNKEFDKLLRRQEDDIKKVQDFHNKAIKLLKRKQTQEVEVLEKSIINLQRKDPKAINKKLYALKPSLINANEHALQIYGDDEDFAFLSPRTASKYSIFRDTDSFELKVTPPSHIRIDEIINEVMSMKSTTPQPFKHPVT